MRAKLLAYYYLTKPGIIRGNLLAATAGFFFAAQTNVDGGVLFGLLLGTTGIVGSACAFNNYIDRDIDKKMQRTSGRALVKGSIKPAHALVFATALGLVGAIILITLTNYLTLIVGLVGFVFYIVFYGIAKRRSVHGTLVGSVPGAVPPVAGYTSVTSEIDSAALILFLILVTWQMPHFYAIAIFRLKDYRAAGLPVLPVIKGVAATKKEIIVYIVLFIIAASSLTIFGYTGYTYLAVILLLGLFWLRIAMKGLHIRDDTKWARHVFGFSLIVLLFTSVMIAVGRLLP